MPIIGPGSSSEHCEEIKTTRPARILVDVSTEFSCSLLCKIGSLISNFVCQLHSTSHSGLKTHDLKKALNAWLMSPQLRCQLLFTLYDPQRSSVTSKMDLSNNFDKFVAKVT